jgi:lipoprotein-anchoring transpeptidase ErfK/SrfK
MTSHSRRALGLAVAILASLALPAAALAVPESPPAPVVGAGTIDVPVLRVRSSPARSARVIAKLSEFRPQDYRPRYVLAIARTTDSSARGAWYKITVPGRPNGRVGWVPAGEVSIRPVAWQVVVFRGSRVLQLWKGTQLIYTTKVAVGAPGMETPLGLFYVTVRFKPVAEPFLGAFAFETSAYSKLSDWPGGGVVGIHGWNDPAVLGKAVSHGCIRVSNQAAAALRGRVPVGTPIRVVAG